MRKTVKVIILFITAVLCAGGYKEARAAEATSIAITKENFPDKRVRQSISWSFDHDKNKVLSEDEIRGAEELDIGDEDEREDYDLTGISKLSRLEKVWIDAFEIKNVGELAKLPQLKSLMISAYDPCPIDVRTNPELVELELDVPLKKLDISKNKKLRYLRLENFEMKKLSVTDMPQLKTVRLVSNKFKTAVIKNCPKLKKISFSENKKLEKMTLIQLPNLEYLKTGNVPKLKKLNFKETPNVRTLYVARNKKITKLDLRPLKKLDDFEWRWGRLRSIKFGEKKYLKYLDVAHNKLVGMWNLQKFPKLEGFACKHNKIKKIYAKGHKRLEWISCSYNNLRKIDVRGAKRLELGDEYKYISGNPHVKVLK